MNGFLSINFLNDNKYNYPIELTDIIIAFLGDIFLRFDVCHKSNENIIKNNGYLITTMQTTALIIHPMVGCSIGFSEGINEFHIKCIKPKSDTIGITSDLIHCKIENNWIGEATKETNYYFY